MLKRYINRRKNPDLATLQVSLILLKMALVSGKTNRKLNNLRFTNVANFRI
ncbi:hypothetical protein [Adhaeribacter soli]|uniref:hypothetical protein n=1 Tax=Adhaeribacter soli TaxID=2607655 RepID=UPI0017816CA8|nr:hypothetical protein [Adhaeribacter soli]